MAIEVQDLDAGYAGKPIVTGACFHVADGEMLAVVGRNGTGKSTLLKTIVGLIPAIGGRVLVSEEGHAPGQGEIMYVPQSDRLIRRLSVLENLRLAAYGMSQKAFQSAVDEVLAVSPWASLRNLLDRRAGLLSGGESLLAAICCGKMRGKPAKHVVLDEPSAGMDKRNLEGVTSLLLEIKSKPGQVTILAEQDLWTTFSVADRVLVMRPSDGGTYGAAELGFRIVDEIRQEMIDVGSPNPTVLRRMRDLVW